MAFSLVVKQYKLGYLALFAEFGWAAKLSSVSSFSVPNSSLMDMCV